MKEIYKTIEDYPNYEVSNLGNVRNKKTGRVLRPSVDKDGYLYVQLYNDNKPKTFRIHRLVTSTLIPNPENKKEVNHINGDKTNNCVSNLEWCTRSENVSHAYRAGLKFHSGGSPKQKVRCIETGQIFESQHQASRYFGCAVTQIRQSILNEWGCKGYHFELVD